MCPEVTRSWQNIVRTTERVAPYWDAPVTMPAPSGHPALHGNPLQFEARRLRLQDFADSGPPGCAAHRN